MKYLNVNAGCSPFFAPHHDIEGSGRRGDFSRRTRYPAILDIFAARNDTGASMNRGRLIGALVFLVACEAAAVSLHAASSPSPPPGSPQTIKVVMDNNYPPYVFLDDGGNLQGILIDQWRLWERKTGIKAEIHAMDWGKALRRMESGEFDVIDTIFLNEPRRRIFDFSRPYAKLDVPVFFEKNISGITDASSLKGFPVAVKAGDAAVEYLEKRGADRLVPFDSYEEIIRAARDHKVSVFVVDKPPAMYFLYKMGIHDRFNVSAPLYTGEFHRAVLKGNRAILEIVEEGFARITPREQAGIERKWYGSPPLSALNLKYLVLAVVAGAGLILVLAGWNRSLRRSVERKTAELKEEMTLTAKQAEKLQASEENYRLVVENANDAILIARNGIILFANPRVSDLMGIPDIEITGRPFETLIHPEDRDKVARYHISRMRGEEVPMRYEFRAVSGSGDTLWFQNNVVITTWEGERATLSFLRDVTRQRKLEDQLAQSRKMEAIGRLAGGIAHDFNNLLSVIIGYSHLILSRLGEDEPFRKDLSEIQKAADRAADLTRQLLAFSRRQLLQPKVVCLNDTVSGMMTFLRRLIGEDIELSFSLQENLPPVLVDPGQVEQVILNLTINARDAMPHGGRLTIGTETVHLSEPFAQEHPPLAPGEHVVLSVSDTGAGMDQGTISKIFEPFFTTKEQGKGTGLGLSTVEGIVSQSKGHISVESEPGRGTTFRIYLPAVGEVPARNGETGQDKAVGGHETILVVEDDPGVQNLVRQVLSTGGYSVLVASNGEEAVRLSREREEPIHLLVTDVVMPGMSGRVLANRIVGQRPRVKVLYMSGYTDDAIGQHGVLEEGIELIEKPFSPAVFAKKVRKVLDA
jgi:two-component system sensor histidine kinase EvgS